MTEIKRIQQLLRQSVTQSVRPPTYFFKTGPGDYAEHDQFLGVTTPNLRKIAKKFEHLNVENIQILMDSPFNEERLLALFILIQQYPKDPDAVYQFYMANLKQVNNWNLVDVSAHLILGRYLAGCDRELLIDLARSSVLWERRISMVSTWYFIKNSDCEWTFKIAEQLLKDRHDLIHKAVGWMLREAGKKNMDQLIDFLDQHDPNMPRTMLRYAIEKFPKDDRLRYLNI